MKICIPTLLCYDKCATLLHEISFGEIKPDEVYVFDNGGGFQNYLKEHPVKIQMPLKIVEANTNFGVAKTWNWFLTNVEGNMIILNDDIEFYSDTLNQFIKTWQANYDKNVVFYSCSQEDEKNYPNGNYSFFMVNSSIKDKVGYFDENFFPAYFEDNDYVYRIKLLGFKTKLFCSMHYNHHLSSTLKKQKELGLNEKHDENFEKNHQYFLQKWGGEPEHEIFTTPYSDPSFTPKNWRIIG